MTLWFPPVNFFKKKRSLLDKWWTICDRRTQSWPWGVTFLVFVKQNQAGTELKKMPFLSETVLWKLLTQELHCGLSRHPQFQPLNGSVSTHFCDPDSKEGSGWFCHIYRTSRKTLSNLLKPVLDTVDSMLMLKFRHSGINKVLSFLFYCHNNVMLCTNLI